MLDSALLTNIASHQQGAFGLIPFTSVSTDTRTIEQGALFVPLSGERFNGHRFLQTAINNGAIASLWQEDEEIPEVPEDFTLFIVKDTLSALQQMAKVYRDKINPFVIGITGSNGKTTTKDIMSSILSFDGETYKTQGNYNNHIGMPLTILAMPQSTKYLVLEMGMSGYGEIELLSKLAQPDFAMVTNIGESHMEQLGSREGIAKAKMEIRYGLKEQGQLFLDGDEPLLESYFSSNCISVGTSHNCQLKISDVETSVDGFSFKFEGESFLLPMLGFHNVKNASYCVAVANRLGLSKEVIQSGLNNLAMTSMRLQKQVGSSGELIINDAYNASPTSMRAAVVTLKEIPGFTKKIAVLGDMFELGEEEEAYHRSIAEVLEIPIDAIVFVGEKMGWLFDEWEKKKLPINSLHVISKEEAIPFLKQEVNNETVILFKASRGMKLEDLINGYQSTGKEE